MKNNLIYTIALLAAFAFAPKMDAQRIAFVNTKYIICLLYTSDAADERSSVDLGGRRIINKKNTEPTDVHRN